MTIGILTYTNDQRYQAIHTEGSDEWSLRVTSPQPRDSGVYECQVSTEPKISQAYRLNVVGKLKRTKILVYIHQKKITLQTKAILLLAGVETIKAELYRNNFLFNLLFTIKRYLQSLFKYWLSKEAGKAVVVQQKTPTYKIGLHEIDEIVKSKPLSAIYLLYLVNESNI